MQRALSSKLRPKWQAHRVQEQSSSNTELLHSSGLPPTRRHSYTTLLLQASGSTQLLREFGLHRTADHLIRPGDLSCSGILWKLLSQPPEPLPGFSPYTPIGFHSERSQRIVRVPSVLGSLPASGGLSNSAGCLVDL